MAEPDVDGEELLADEGVTRVVRVGDTVRRPWRAFTPTVQAYLAHLHRRGFTEAPVPLGRDEHGREVLSYVGGDVPVDPLPDWAVEPEVIAALARLIRRLHDSAQGWDLPPDAVWGRMPGATPAGVVPLFDAPTLVAHQDYCPGNVVFRAGLPVAFIDFDFARPTTRIADAVNAVYWWAPLLDPVDRAPALVEADAAVRVRMFADAYGMDAAQRVGLVSVARRMVANMTLTMRAAAEVDPVFRRWWDEGVKDRMPRAQRWMAANADRLLEELLR